MSAITAKASRKMKKYAVLTREPRCFLGSFDFSWEQRKFEEIAVRSSVICSDDTLPRVEYEDIVSGTGRLNKDIYAKQSSKSGIVFHQGDVLYGKLRPYLQNWLLPTFDGLAVGDFWVLQPQNADSSFLYRLIQSRQFDEVANQSTGTKMPRADWKLVSKTVFSIPSNISEQAAIGTYFTALDSLITLHQRKCALLFSPFQAFISMMFITSTFSWEQRKLGDIASDMVAGGDIDKDLILAEGQYPVIANALTGDGIVGYYDKEYRVNAPAVTVTGRGDVGHAKARLVNFTPVVRLLSVKSEHDVFFLENAINTLKIVIESTGVPQLTVPQLAKYEVAFPRQLDEEEHIGAFFKQLDHLITLHQRKCIFFTGRAGRLISTVNKKRITSSWEQRKLSEITDKVTEKNAGLQYVETFTNSAEFGIISQRDFFDHDIAKLGSLDGYYIVKTEDFVYNPRISTSAPVGPINRNKLGRTGVMSPLYTVFRPHDIDTTYLEYFFKCGYWHSFMNFNGDSGARSDRFSIRDNVFFQMPIPIPDIDEQRKIGELLTCLDNLITLHQRKPFLMKWRTSDANRNQTNRLVL